MDRGFTLAPKWLLALDCLQQADRAILVRSMRRLAVPEGPEIGRILRELRTECALGRHGTKEEVLERGAALLSSKNTHTE